MTDDDIKKWLINKINSCYQVTYNRYKSNIFLYYDKSYLRKMKLCKLSKYDINLSNDISGICLFYVDINNKVLYFDSVKIFAYIKNNSQNKTNSEIMKIITDAINCTDKLCKYAVRSSFGPIIQVDTSNEHKISRNEFTL